MKCDGKTRRDEELSPEELEAFKRFLGETDGKK